LGREWTQIRFRIYIGSLCRRRRNTPHGNCSAREEDGTFAANPDAAIGDGESEAQFFGANVFAGRDHQFLGCGSQMNSPN
jgi:hypothetical protein